MVTYGKIRTSALILEPVTSQTAPNTLWWNSTLDSLNSNSTSGTPTPVVSVDMIKRMQCFAPIAKYKPVSKRSDGKIMTAESDAVGTQQFIGIAADNFVSANDLGNILLVGQNVAGALTGLGFVPGDEIYIGETTGGYVNDISGFTGNDDSLIKVGIADCAAGTASGTATDLILFAEVIARP